MIIYASGMNGWNGREISPLGDMDGTSMGNFLRWDLEQWSDPPQWQKHINHNQEAPQSSTLPMKEPKYIYNRGNK